MVKKVRYLKRKYEKKLRHVFSDERVYARKKWRESWPDRHGLSEKKLRDRFRNKYGFKFVKPFDIKADRKRKAAKKRWKSEKEKRARAQEAEKKAQEKLRAERSKDKAKAAFGPCPETTVGRLMQAVGMRSSGDFLQQVMQRVRSRASRVGKQTLSQNTPIAPTAPQKGASSVAASASPALLDKADSLSARTDSESNNKATKRWFDETPPDQMGLGSSDANAPDFETVPTVIQDPGERPNTAPT